MTSLRPPTSATSRSPGGTSRPERRRDAGHQAQTVKCPARCRGTAPGVQCSSSRTGRLQSGIVEIPMRIVGGEEQPVDADPFHHVVEVLAPFRLFHRLRREPDMLADVFRRPALQMRRLVAQPSPVLVQPPHQRRQPGDAGLDEQHPQAGKALEHAFQHEAGQQRLAALRVADHLLDVVGRPAAAGDRKAAIAEGMHGNRQPRAFGGCKDRPVFALAQRLGGAAQDQ